MPICQPPTLRRARPGAVPDQPPLRRRRPGLDLHGRDPRGAHRGVPRGERLPGAGHVRGLVAAGRAATRPTVDGPGPAVPARRAARRSTTASTCRTCSTSTPALRRRPAAPARCAPAEPTGLAAERGYAGRTTRLSGDLSLTSGRIRPAPIRSPPLSPSRGAAMSIAPAPLVARARPAPRSPTAVVYCEAQLRRASTARPPTASSATPSATRSSSVIDSDAGRPRRRRGARRRAQRHPDLRRPRRRRSTAAGASPDVFIFGMAPVERHALAGRARASCSTPSPAA